MFPFHSSEVFGQVSVSENSLFLESFGVTILHSIHNKSTQFCWKLHLKPQFNGTQLILLPYLLISGWIRDKYFCRVLSYLQSVSIASSIFILIAISIERSMSIANPIKYRLKTRNFRIIMLVIWLSSLMLNVPWIFVFHSKMHASNFGHVCNLTMGHRTYSNFRFSYLHSIASNCGHRKGWRNFISFLWISEFAISGRLSFCWSVTRSY